MKRACFLISILFYITAISAAPVDGIKSLRVAKAQLQRLERSDLQLTFRECISNQQRELARIYSLSSGGYIVVCADDVLPPVIAYSLSDSFTSPQGNLLSELIEADLSFRMQAYSQQSYRQDHSQAWEALLSEEPVRDFEQWPPDGYSTTGGWCKTLWNQTAPYNSLCPMDPVTNQRSIAGCPAVAIAQIINYHETLNGTVFSDADDYHHNYAGRNYWIDDDFATLSFPSFPQLNTYLANLQHSWSYQEDQASTDRAALIFACGVAAEQVFTSQSSGTFAVSQAYAAIQRFGFDGSQLITDPESNYRDLMAQNMMDAQPALLAVVTPAWDAGHNVVVDGYNTDGFFHINFGWGGSYNAWYQVPGGLPYNLTVLEGVVLDIAPLQALFHMPETLAFGYNVSNQQAELINISSQPLVIEAVQVRPSNIHNDPFFMLTIFHPALPYTLGAGQSVFISLALVQGDYTLREILDYELAIIHANGVYHIPVQVDTQYLSPNADEELPQALAIYLGPNPFRDVLTIRTKGTMPAQACVYDLRGRKLQSLSWLQDDPAQASCMWDGRDMAGRNCPAGIYLVRVTSGSRNSIVKVVKL